MDNKVQLITYANRFGGNTLASLTRVLRTYFDGVYQGVHILPFFTPYDGADAGFDPIDHRQVDPRLGTWDDVAELSRSHKIMVDAIVNHMSSESEQFREVRVKGKASPYYSMFLTMSSVFPDGADEEDLARIYRPRPGLPFTHYTWAGETRLVWTTFTPQQVDIDTDSSQGWAYLTSILDRLAASNVSYIRLDAVGYGAKQAGTSCFMTPKTFDLITRIKQEAATRGLETLIEVHSNYRKQIDIASKVDRVYDFALPPLLLHTIFTGDIAALAHWIEVRPINAVTVLDTHDGIGVIDIGADQMNRSLKGLVDDAAVDQLVRTIHCNTYGQSEAATGAAASNLDLYQINTTYYSALACHDRAYLAARAVQFFLPGVPQVYYVGALAGANDMDLLARTRNGRDINRHYYTEGEIERNLTRPVVRSLNALCRLRNKLDAFNGKFSYRIDATRGALRLVWQGKTSKAELIFCPSAAIGTFPALSDRTETIGENGGNASPQSSGKDPSLATLVWSDAQGSHLCRDLLTDLGE